MKPTNNTNKIPLSVGYSQTSENQPFFYETIERYKDYISEVYFAFTGVQSGRSVLGNGDFFESTEQLIFELNEISKLGIRLNLLFNAACYGDEALSKSHEEEIINILNFLGNRVKTPESVTTLSPVIAQIVRNFDKNIDIRASVNMKISSIKSVQYVEHLFDSFCLSKDINRDFEQLKEVSNYIKKQGKKVSLLANSGCLRNCSMQTFHDNVVAHENGVLKRNNIEFAAVSGCHHFLSSEKNHFKFLQNTWIRPDDLHYYEGIIDIAKIATRSHDRPEAVIGAYAKGNYHANLSDLFEPSHSHCFAPFVVDNDCFPDNWFEITSKCDKQCHKCSYCKEVWENVKVKINE